VAYNVVSALGWAYVLALTVTHILNLDGKADTFVASHAKTATSVLSRFLSTVTLPKALRFLSPKTLDAYLPAALQPIYRRTETTFARVGPTTAFVQTFALLEVVHAALGWVRSPVVTTAMQVSSRLFLVWGIAEQFPQVRNLPTICDILVKQLFLSFRSAPTPYIRAWFWRGPSLK
jgi:very-long-chain (3R)-3-hydroxyacyl-CoA dehydratase